MIADPRCNSLELPLPTERGLARFYAIRRRRELAAQLAAAAAMALALAAFALLA